MSAPSASALAPTSRPQGTLPALSAGLIGTAVAALVLADRTGLGGLFVGAALAVYAGIAALVLVHISASHRVGCFGVPNGVTLVRAVATALLCGYAVEAAAGFVPTERNAWAFAGLAAGAIVIDGLDGLIARRIGPATAFGARFDMEVDALMLAALSLVAFALGKAGVFVLAIGLMRYAFVGAAHLWPWLAGDLAPSFRRKAVCVLQGAALVALVTPALGPDLGGPVAAAALAALGFSFAVDVKALADLRGSATE